MQIKLDDVDLVKTTKDESNVSILDIRAIYRMSFSDKRNIIELKIPGSASNFLQDMGAESVIIEFEGEIMGPKSSEILEKLYVKYNQGRPFEFYSDMTIIAEVHKVLIKNLHVEQVAGIESSYQYNMILQEYKEPREQMEEAPPSQDQDAKEEVEEESEIEDIRGQVLDSEGNPAAGIKVKIRGPDGEKEVSTDEDGYYELLDVPEGSYVVTSDADGYQDLKVEFEVKKGAD